MNNDVDTQERLKGAITNEAAASVQPLNIYDELKAQMRAYQIGTRTFFTSEDLAKWSEAIEHHIALKIYEEATANIAYQISTRSFLTSEDLTKWSEAFEHHIALKIYDEPVANIAYQIGTRSFFTSENLAKWSEAVEHHIALKVYDELTAKMQAYQMGTGSALTSEEFAKWSAAIEYRVNVKLLGIKIEVEYQEINDGDLNFECLNWKRRNRPKNSCQ